ncbi:MAG: hypothetical protein QM808_04435 [Steroidobacteraceae bacterium]
MNRSAFSLRRELLIALLVIALTVLIVPGVIYAVGTRLFGVYGADGIGGIYGAVLIDLAVPRLAAWTIFLGPAVCVALIRLVFQLTGNPAPSSPPTQRSLRREPTIQG